MEESRLKYSFATDLNEMQIRLVDGDREEIIVAGST